MKELSNHDKLSDKQSTEIQVKKNQQVEYTKDETLRPMYGHRLWEIDLSSMKVKEAEYSRVTQTKWVEIVNGYIESTREVIKRKGCVYISALTAKKAIERHLKGKGSAKLSTEQKALA